MEKETEELLQKLIGENHQNILRLADLASQFIGVALPHARAIAATSKEALETESVDFEEIEEEEASAEDVDRIIDNLLGDENG